MGLNLGGSWQQGHSATYNTRRRVFKSSAKGFKSPPGLELCFRAAPVDFVRPPGRRLRPRALGSRKAPNVESASKRRRWRRSSLDSDLEAFSHNPTPRVKLTCLHDGLNPAHVPYWWVNNPTLGEFCFTMIGRADIEGSKNNVAMNAWLPQASYPRVMCRPSQTPHLTMSSAGSARPRRGEPWNQKEGQCPASD
ncbi:hypothetical protein H6P81_021245 [Aristolochia fimbriata]|uniref:Uncharacterized protein n=1 Tax=Aristolochia fimbriata TaxID=158543 RepID=A0AAV7DQK9_ARIFI|nr:hypothetical protein H6P81_021245 [Aristolochia fimbriata]